MTNPDANRTAPSRRDGAPRVTTAGPRARHTRLSHRNHMSVRWHDVIEKHDHRAVEASLADKSTIVCRVGLLLLASGTGAWRVREAMNATASVLGITCSADVSLTSIECSCFDETGSFSEVVSLSTTGVNTERIWNMERLVARIKAEGATLTVSEFHDLMDDIERMPTRYAPWQAGLAAAAACAAFVFLLGGGPFEMLFAFAGAGCGGYLRRIMLDRHLTHLACVGASVAVACLVYLCAQHLVGAIVSKALDYNAGYIGAMLFVIPGFPLITSGLDIAKLDLRSGIERLVYALSIIITATLVAWLISSIVGLRPDEFSDLSLSPVALTVLRAVMSFVGVFGFSVLFNSSRRMAATAGVVGAIANTLRLTLVDLQVTPEGAAFAGALAAGLLASAVMTRAGFPRVSITVPSIVIMVPGLYLYRAVYYMGTVDVVDSMEWIVRAVMIILFLPMGLGLARVLTDREWRHCN